MSRPTITEGIHMIHAVGYMRTSSAANVGEGKDSEPRQRAAIAGYAAEAGYERTLEPIDPTGVRIG